MELPERHVLVNKLIDSKGDSKTRKNLLRTYMILKK